MRSKIALKNISTTLFLQLVTIICGFIIPKLIIQSYGSAVNGLVSSIAEFLGYITLLEAGFGPVIKSMLYKPIAEKNDEEIKGILKSAESFFKNIAYIFVAYILVLCIFYPMIVAKDFNNIYTFSLILIISISTFAEYYFGMTYRLFLQANQKTYVISGIQVSTLILNTIVTILLIKLGFSIHIVKLASAGIYVFRPILINLYVKKKFDIKISKDVKKVNIDKKWDGLAQHIAAVIHNNTDIAVLTIFTNVVEVSVYAVYKLVVAGVKNLVGAFTSGMDASFGDMLARNEKSNLNKSFKVYELFYFSLITIVFSCTMLLIVPFIKVYTFDITDANYIRPLFAILIVIAEFMHSTRLPYSTLTLAAGHFKETMKGAWVESISNIVISIILVFKFGIVGVAIGTLVAMAIRTFEFMFHTSKCILERSIWIALSKLLVIAFEVCLIAVISSFINVIEMISYINWVIYAIQIFAISVIVVLPINALIYRKEVKGIFVIAKNLIKK